jgi:hypothetical protein
MERLIERVIHGERSDLFKTSCKRWSYAHPNLLAPDESCSETLCNKDFGAQAELSGLNLSVKQNERDPSLDPILSIAR